MINAETVAKGLTILRRIGLGRSPDAISTEMAKVWLGSMRRHSVTEEEFKAAIIAWYEGEGNGFWPIPGDLIKLIVRRRQTAALGMTFRAVREEIDDEGNIVTVLALCHEDDVIESTKALPAPEDDWIPMAKVHRLIAKTLESKTDPFSG